MAPLAEVKDKIFRNYVIGWFWIQQNLLGKILNIVWHVSIDRHGSVSKKRNPKIQCLQVAIWLKCWNYSLILWQTQNHSSNNFFETSEQNLKLGEKSTKNISGLSTQVFVLQIFHQKICGNPSAMPRCPRPWGAIRFYSLLASGLIRCRWSIRWLFLPWGGMECQFKAKKKPWNNWCWKLVIDIDLIDIFVYYFCTHVYISMVIRA